MTYLWRGVMVGRQSMNPDRAQKLISSSMSRHLSTRNISSKSIHAFLSNLAHRQTNTGKNMYLLLCRRINQSLNMLIAETAAAGPTTW